MRWRARPHQIAAVAGVLVWMLAVEQTLMTTYPPVGRWLPVGATFGLLQLGPLGTTKSALLDAPLGGLVLAGYTALVGLFAFVGTPRRDVL